MITWRYNWLRMRWEVDASPRVHCPACEGPCILYRET